MREFLAPLAMSASQGEAAAERGFVCSFPDRLMGVPDIRAQLGFGNWDVLSP
jgi:hypothetical protein